MSRRRTSLAELERLALLKAQGRAEAAALEAGLAESRALAEARGAAFDRPAAKRSETPRPLRRLTGLAWLKAKGRLNEDQLAAGLRYGAVWRRAQGEARLSSILGNDGLAAGTGGGGPTIARVMAEGEARAHAGAKLAMYRRQLQGEPALVAACDQVCGAELTPREASANGRDAGVTEAMLGVALNLLARAAGAPSTPRAREDELRR